jgi:hypothetical protein
LTLAQIRALFGGVSKVTIAKWVRLGTLPAPVVMGGRGKNCRRFWRLADVDARLAEVAAAAQKGVGHVG